MAKAIVCGNKGHRFGRRFEKRIEDLLVIMKKEGLIDQWQRYKPHSKEDRSGYDFSVYREDEKVDFGVTVSSVGFRRAKHNHPGVTTLRFRPHSTDDEIIKKISEIFKTPRYVPQNVSPKKLYLRADPSISTVVLGDIWDQVKK
jgi:hypothetical protein